MKDWKETRSTSPRLTSAPARGKHVIIYFNCMKNMYNKNSSSSKAAPRQSYRSSATKKNVALRAFHRITHWKVNTFTSITETKKEEISNSGGMGHGMDVRIIQSDLTQNEQKNFTTCIINYSFFQTYIKIVRNSRNRKKDEQTLNSSFKEATSINHRRKRQPYLRS